MMVRKAPRTLGHAKDTAPRGRGTDRRMSTNAGIGLALIRPAKRAARVGGGVGLGRGVSRVVGAADDRRGAAMASGALRARAVGV